MDARVVVNIVVDSVAPRIPPAIALKQVFEYGGRIEIVIEPHRAAINYERPARMVRDNSVVLKAKGLRFSLTHQLGQLALPRPCQARGPFGAFSVSNAGIVAPVCRSGSNALPKFAQQFYDLKGVDRGYQQQTRGRAGWLPVPAALEGLGYPTFHGKLEI